MRQAIALVLCTLLLCGVFAVSAHAAEAAPGPSPAPYSEVPPGFDYTGSTLSYTAPATLDDTFALPCGDTGFTQLHSVLDPVVLPCVVQAGDAFYAVSLPIAWDFSTVDANTPGSYTASGSILLPAGAALAGGLAGTITVAVQVAAPATFVLASFDEPERVDAVAFATGTSTATLEDWFSSSVMGFTGYDAAGNPYDLLSGTWSFAAVNTAVPGVYYAFVSPSLGADYTLQAGTALPRQLCTVSIQTPGQPDLNCCVAGRGFLHFPWVLSAAQEEQLGDFTLWLRQDDGEWANLQEGFLFVADGLQLSQRMLSYGSTYALKVAYPGGETGVLTFTYSDALHILDYSGGDRDGGDAGGEDAQTGTQTAPTTPETPADTNGASTPAGGDATPVLTGAAAGGSPTTQGTAAVQEQAPQPSTPGTPAVKGSGNSSAAGPATAPPAVVNESYTPEETVISGLRLRDLCGEGDTVVFGSGNLTASIPSALLLALHLQNTDTLSVSLACPQNGQLVFRVTAGGKPVAPLTGTTLRLRYLPQAQNAVILVQNESGVLADDISYDGEFLRFTVNDAGSYTVSEQQNPQKGESKISPLLPVSGSLILAACGGTLLKRWRHG